MNSTWDTTSPVFEYPKYFRKIYESVYVSQRKSFADWIGDISKTFKDDVDWWISPVSSRNTYISDLFHNICILESLKKLKNKKNSPSIVIINSNVLKKIIQNYFKKKIKIKTRSKKNSFVKKIYLIFYSTFLMMFILLISKLYNNKKKKLNGNNKKNVLIDTFVTSNNLKNDRYYNKLGRKKKSKKNVFFVPTILSLKIFKLPALIKEIRNKRNFILKEDFIYISDILFAFFYIFRKKKFYVNYLRYKNWDLSSLIKEELYLTSNFQTTLIALINYRFAKNLKNKNIKIKKVINWFENTSVDKGWNFGFRSFFPKTTLIGYQGFTLYKQFMPKHPSQAEYLYKVIPNIIVVIGNAYKKIRTEFCKKIKIQTGPALRFEHLYSYKYVTKKKYDILLSLNLDLEVSKKIIESVFATEWFKNGNKIFIKSHPFLSLSKIMPNKEMPSNLHEVKGDFFSIAKNSKIVISSGISSSIVESFFCGCAVLVPYTNKHDYYNFKQLKISSDNYKICENAQQLNNGINHFLSEEEKTKKKRIKKINILKKNLFQKTTSENLAIFS